MIYNKFFKFSPMNVHFLKNSYLNSRANFRQRIDMGFYSRPRMVDESFKEKGPITIFATKPTII